MVIDPRSAGDHGQMTIHGHEIEQNTSAPLSPQELYEQSMRRQTRNILLDPTHVLYPEYELLSSGRRYRVPLCLLEYEANPKNYYCDARMSLVHHPHICHDEQRVTRPFEEDQYTCFLCPVCIDSAVADQFDSHTAGSAGPSGETGNDGDLNLRVLAFTLTTRVPLGDDLCPGAQEVSRTGSCGVAVESVGCIARSDGGLRRPIRRQEPGPCHKGGVTSLRGLRREETDTAAPQGTSSGSHERSVHPGKERGEAAWRSMDSPPRRFALALLGSRIRSAEQLCFGNKVEMLKRTRRRQSVYKMLLVPIKTWKRRKLPEVAVCTHDVDFSCCFGAYLAHTDRFYSSLELLECELRSGAEGTASSGSGTRLSPSRSPGLVTLHTPLSVSPPCHSPLGHCEQKQKQPLFGARRIHRGPPPQTPGPRCSSLYYPKQISAGREALSLSLSVCFSLSHADMWRMHSNGSPSCMCRPISQ
ncbi:hypothetical protein WMY93_024582 [Mugilogobius chulae]|uniref:Uncharacterized protein n=1 Tax=Mugilogobius chulae TaxID=88201 RepID=A0AAW0N4K5_9GOBI